MLDNEEKYYDIQTKLDIIRQKLREDMNNEIEIEKDKLFKIKISICLVMQIIYCKNNSYILFNYFRNLLVKCSNILYVNALFYFPILYFTILYEHIQIFAKYLINYSKILCENLLLYLPKIFYSVKICGMYLINYFNTYKQSLNYLLIIDVFTNSYLNYFLLCCIDILL